MKTVCQVCIHHCNLEPGQRGLCGARENIEGVIQCRNYGQITSLALDPIEKKPLRLFYPGRKILSVGSFGCNLKCPFCQNYRISMDRKGEGSVYLSPRELAEKALACQREENIGVAFTYNEPLIGWEYVRDTADFMKKYGMETVLVTNGMASLDILEELLPWVDAMNIDLKGFQQSWYERLGGDLETVKAFIARAAECCHVELTTLVVPGENDTVGEMAREAQWIASVDSEIPLHITRFFPRYHMQDREATNVAHIYRLAGIAEKYLKHVYVGNC